VCEDADHVPHDGVLDLDSALQEVQDPVRGEGVQDVVAVIETVLKVGVAVVLVGVPGETVRLIDTVSVHEAEWDRVRVEINEHEADVDGD